MRQNKWNFSPVFSSFAVIHIHYYDFKLDQDEVTRC